MLISGCASRKAFDSEYGGASSGLRQTSLERVEFEARGSDHTSE
jgi:hypothetical protein